MDIETPDIKFKNISYNDSSFSEWENMLTKEADQKTHHLCLFLGLYDPNKKKALEKIGKKLNRNVQIVDTDELVTEIESETFKNLDELFEGLHQSEDIIYLDHGDRLCGTYTGFTRSRVKYATPQERYFLKKVKAFDGLVIVDVDEFSDADTTLRRAAKSIVSFNLPDSKWKRFVWHLKNFSPNGYDLRSKRPDAYGEVG